jgi:hypothetical protein
MFPDILCIGAYNRVQNQIYITTNGIEHFCRGVHFQDEPLHAAPHDKQNYSGPP